MRLSSLVSVILSTVFVAQQVSCGYQISSWWEPKTKKDIKEVQASIRVPFGSDPEETYWSAFYFTRSYIGMQHNHLGERRIIFSVWNDGNKGSVPTIEVGNGTIVEDYNGEGSGTHGLVRYNWKTEETVFFKVTADIHPEKNGTIYSGYFSSDEGKNWNLIASFLRENVQMYITGLAGFLEQLDGTENLREGFWGNHTVVTTDNETIPVTDFYLSTSIFNLKDTWMYKTHIGPNNEYYQRINGKKDEGVYPPTNPPK